MSFFNIPTSLLTSYLVLIGDQWKSFRSIVQTSSKLEISRQTKSPPVILVGCDLSGTLTKEEIEVLSEIDLDEYYVNKIVSHEKKGREPKNWKFKVRWVEY